MQRTTSFSPSVRDFQIRSYESLNIMRSKSGMISSNVSSLFFKKIKAFYYIVSCYVINIGFPCDTGSSGKWIGFIIHIASLLIFIKWAKDLLFVIIAT